ncbi:MAG: hypothetical protein M3083_20575 [Actinomycetota bacterium]|nr:hypothetical protein [Actinomycetota bacterium]
MGTIVGLVIGYALGTRAGENGWVEFRDSLKTITTSEEVRDLVSVGFSIARDLLQRASLMLADRLQGSDVGAVLRPAA